jgi:hypothetical protein
MHNVPRCKLTRRNKRKFTVMDEKSRDGGEIVWISPPKTAKDAE